MIQVLATILQNFKRNILQSKISKIRRQKKSIRLRFELIENGALQHFSFLLNEKLRQIYINLH